MIKKRSDKAEGRGQEGAASELDGDEVRGKEWVEGNILSSLNPWQKGEDSAVLKYSESTDDRYAKRAKRGMLKVP